MYCIACLYIAGVHEQLRGHGEGPRGHHGAAVRAYDRLPAAHRAEEGRHRPPGPLQPAALHR